MVQHVTALTLILASKNNKTINKQMHDVKQGNGRTSRTISTLIQASIKLIKNKI